MYFISSNFKRPNSKFSIRKNIQTLTRVYTQIRCRRHDIFPFFRNYKKYIKKHNPITFEFCLVSLFLGFCPTVPLDRSAAAAMTQFGGVERFVTVASRAASRFRHHGGKQTLIALCCVSSSLGCCCSRRAAAAGRKRG